MEGPMSKAKFVAVGAFLGAIAASGAFALTAIAQIPPPPQQLPPGYKNPILTKPVTLGNRITITCPDTAPSQFTWDNGWFQVVYGGGLIMAPSYVPSDNSIVCQYGGTPGAAAMTLTNHFPAGVKNCAVTSDKKSITCFSP
jgi:hypothetical protein